MLLQPKKQKYRKQQKGRSKKRKKETRGMVLNFGQFGLQSQGVAWFTSNQIEAARKAIVNFLKREGRLWIRIFPDKPITKFPPEVGMGKGKGAVDHYVFPVRAGRIIFEIDGVSKERATQALKRGSFKLPVKTKIIIKE